MTRTKLAPVLGALLEDLRTTDKHRKPLPGDTAILRIAGDELRAMRAVASAAERAIPYAIGLDVGMTMIVPTHPPLEYPGPPKPLAHLQRALDRLDRLSSPPSRPRKANR